MAAAWYTIRVSGALGRTTLGAFPDLQSDVQGSQTSLSGKLPDCSALYGIVARLEALGLELIDIRRLAAPPEPSSEPQPVEPPGAPEPGQARRPR